MCHNDDVFRIFKFPLKNGIASWVNCTRVKLSDFSQGRKKARGQIIDVYSTVLKAMN